MLKRWIWYDSYVCAIERVDKVNYTVRLFAVTAYRKRKTRIRSTFNTVQISECPSRLCPLMQNPDDVTAVV